MTALRNRLAPIRGIPTKGGGLKVCICGSETCIVNFTCLFSEWMFDLWLFKPFLDLFSFSLLFRIGSPLFLQLYLTWTFVVLICIFVCKRYYAFFLSFFLSSVFFELNSPVGTYEVFWILKLHFFSKAHHFSGKKCGIHLPLLCAVWKFCKNLIKPRFICAASSTSPTGVANWLSSFSKVIPYVVNDLWVLKLRMAHVFLLLVGLWTTNCTVYWASFYLFSYEWLFEASPEIWPCFAQRLSLVLRFVDDLVVWDFLEFDVPGQKLIWQQHSQKCIVS